MHRKLNQRELFLVVICAAAVVGCGDTDAQEVEAGSSSGSSGGDTQSVPPNPTAPDPGATSGQDGTSDGEDSQGPGDTTAGGGDPQSCCEVHSGGGCNEPEVANCVCAQEATCCAFDWDQTCVDLALNECRATCEDPGGSTGDPTDPSGDPTDPSGEPGACADIVEFEMFPSEATHSGSWVQSMSMVGEGEISVFTGDAGLSGSILYEPDIPCDDTWHIWVRYWEDGTDDSYFATLDGAPDPEAIFAADCTPAGDGYSWAELNWASPDTLCEYVENPWAPTWDAGTHQIEFSFRESFAMGRILITNDPNFTP